MNKIFIDGILSYNVNSVWDKILPQIEESLDNGRSTSLYPEDIKEQLLNRDMQLWGIYRDGDMVAFAITQITITKYHKELFVVITAGVDMDQWLDQLVGTLSEFAKHNGCKYFKCHGRKGWVKALKRLGFSDPSVTCCKEL